TVEERAVVDIGEGTGRDGEQPRRVLRRGLVRDRLRQHGRVVDRGNVERRSRRGGCGAVRGCVRECRGGVVVRRRGVGPGAVHIVDQRAAAADQGQRRDDGGRAV